MMRSLLPLCRRLAQAPLFTVMCLLTLASGIGANTALFTVVNSVLLKPLPFPEPDRLVAIWHTAQGLNLPRVNASPATNFVYREQNRVFTDVGMWTRGSAAVTGLAEPEHVPEVEVTDGVLQVLGVKPQLGRLFTRQDDLPGSPGTVILTHGYWQRRFGGGPGVLGKQLLLDGRSYQVIGVMPESWRFLDVPHALILPLQIDRSQVFIGNFSYQGIARLKPNITLAQANADIARLLPTLTQHFPLPPGMNAKMVEEARFGPRVIPLAEDVIGDAGRMLWVLLGTVGLVLLIACANVANLLLVRAEGRQQELAIRAALGAGWGRIARELLLESSVLGCLGGLLGIGVAYGALRLLVWLAPAGLPRLDEIALDGSGILFTVVLSLLAGLAFGLIPVLKYAVPRVSSVLRSGGRTMSAGRERHRARNTLVIGQVALALVLLISAGLMVRTLIALQRVSPGFTAPEQVQTMRLYVPESQVKEPERVPRFYADLLQRLSTLQGVQSVAAVHSVTMDGRHNNDPVFAQDRTYSAGTIPPIRRFKHMTPGLFRTMGNPLLAGRDIEWNDVYERRPVVLVSQALARELWGSPAAALGKRIRESPQGEWREVIGVAGDERDDGPDQPAPGIVYFPMAVSNFWGQPVQVHRTMAIAIRTPRAGTRAFLKEVQQTVWSLDRNLPLADVGTMDQIYRRSLARTSFTLVMLSLAAGMALLLGVIGIYGVIAYAVTQRTREIGIRMALGAQQGAIRQLFVRQGLMLAGLGVLCGLAAALPLSRFLGALLYEVSPFDPVTYLLVPVVLVAAAVVAAWVPTYRATRTEPVIALRME